MSSDWHRPIILLAGEGPTSRMVFHALRRNFGEIAVILEDRPSRVRMLRRRLKTLGPATVAGQVLFQSIVRPLLGWVGSRRIAAIKRTHDLDDSPIGGPIRRVASANSAEARQALRELEPAVVVVVGTRILSAETLACTPAPFINTHGGITPLYRGVHGGYWALAEGRPDLAGTTVHLIDRGIDTGPVLGQATFAVSTGDSFATYPYLHAAAGLPVLLDAVRRALAGDLAAVSNPRGLPSALRTHPTLWGYLGRRITQGVR
jgi:hypothetical protein